jgi:pyruvate dehydrogenase E1 component alpha subunit
MAALFKLPCIFVCENNGYGEFTPQAKHQAIVDVADRAPGYGMPGAIVDGMDAIAVFEAAGEAIARARAGAGPTLLECKTYRYFDHVGVRGMGLKYRTDEEVERWKARDAIAGLEARLAAQGILSEQAARAVHETVLAGVREGIQFAEDSPFPDPATLTDDVYA